ncbi:MAG TPA: hypothetical protein VIQ74_09340, partial [Gemmatimonadaceae bacterium]
MKPKAECCGWASWGELAGIGPDGRPVGWQPKHHGSAATVVSSERITPLTGAIMRSPPTAGTSPEGWQASPASTPDEVRKPGVVGIYPSRLIHRELVAEQTLAIVLERPEGFVFRTGQYVDVTLPEPLFDDLLGPTRSFALASAPGERDLLLVMRMRESAFKRS